jgi:hypothetical protein
MKSDPSGYLLLKCIHSYLELNMYATLELHTMETLTAGWAALLKYSSLIEVRVQIDLSDN